MSCASSATLIGIEKVQPKGAKYPTYMMRVGRNASPINDHIAKLDAEEFRALCPLENTIEVLGEEEHWKYLERVIAPETVAQIRADMAAEKKAARIMPSAQSPE